jgi:nucleoside-diphosphate-sugar epimerase
MLICSTLDVVGVIHTASILNMSPDPNEVVTPVINATVNLAKAAAKFPSIKRFVYTSSSMAVATPQPNKEFTVTDKTWNESSVEAAWAPPPYDRSRGFIVYGASKTQAEQALWKFVEDEKPSFVLNTGYAAVIAI